MGNLATPEALIARWQEALRDPSLQDLPYKIEINAWGKLEMTPASNRHGRLQMAIGAELMRQLPDGLVISECSILTRIGIRVLDVVWASADFMRDFGEITPYVQAPEICIEIISPSNVPAEIEEKRAAYFAAGAREIWLVAEAGTARYFGPAG
ncbi:MAG TPA: Uma2 family endonuclease, partial [Burkholderiales bacterium]|nr:Uma2 family endonuclease [Burkholderiales bacterium]